MFISATNVKFLDGLLIEMTFQDGKIIQYDLSQMETRFPQFKKLRDNRSLFTSGHLDPGGYGVIWNDELDFDAMSIYYGGQIVGYAKTTINQKIGSAIIKARDKKNITQTELAKLSHIDQGDISKLEKGLGNPTLSKISKLIDALDCDIDIVIK